MADYALLRGLVHVKTFLIERLYIYKNKTHCYHKFLILFRTQYFLPSDMILKEGELGNEMFFLTEGTVEVLLKNREAIVLKEGAYFGEVFFLK